MIRSWMGDRRPSAAPWRLTGGYCRMSEYLPWLLIVIVGVIAAAALIYWRMSYIESD
jgi:hypothetical protein